MSEEFTLLSEEELLTGIAKVNRIKHKKSSRKKPTSGKSTSSNYGKSSSSRSKKTASKKRSAPTDQSSGQAASRNAAPARRRKKKSSWGKKLLQFFLRTMLCVVVVAGLLFGGLCMVLNQVFNGPSPAARDVLTMSLLEASGTKWVPGIFLGDEKVAEIRIEEVSGDTYNAYVMIVRDPSRVYLATSSAQFSMSVPGTRITEQIEKEGAIAAVNAGAFFDNGTSSPSVGSVPEGLVISDSKVVWNSGAAPEEGFVGFNQDNVLVVADKMTATEAGQQSEHHYRERHLSHLQDRGNIQGQPEKNDGEFQNLF